MIAQFDNQVMSSFLMWFDHMLLNKGQAHYQVTTTFPQSECYFPGFYAYNAPYKGLVYDTSIAGATVLTGVSINNVNYNLGQSPLTGINHFEGQVLTTVNGATVSGVYSVKEINVLLTSQPEEKILFETNYARRNKTNGLLESLDENSIPYPVIFLRNDGGENVPIAFGGTDQTNIRINAIVIADSQYMLDAIFSIFRDRNYDLVYLINESDNPFNVYGSFKDNIPFNYNNLVAGKDYCTIEKVTVNKIPSMRNREYNLNPSIYYGIIDFELMKFRNPRQ